MSAVGKPRYERGGLNNQGDIHDQQQSITSVVRTGIISDIDADNAKVRVQVGGNGHSEVRDSKFFVTPWIDPLHVSCGSMLIIHPHELNEKVMIAVPSGHLENPWIIKSITSDIRPIFYPKEFFDDGYMNPISYVSLFGLLEDTKYWCAAETLTMDDPEIQTITRKKFADTPLNVFPQKKKDARRSLGFMDSQVLRWNQHLRATWRSYRETVATTTLWRPDKDPTVENKLAAVSQGGGSSEFFIESSNKGTGIAKGRISVLHDGSSYVQHHDAPPKNKINQVIKEGVVTLNSRDEIKDTAPLMRKPPVEPPSPLVGDSYFLTEVIASNGKSGHDVNYHASDEAWTNIDIKGSTGKYKLSVNGATILTIIDGVYHLKADSEVVIESPKITFKSKVHEILTDLYRLFYSKKEGMP